MDSESKKNLNELEMELSKGKMICFLGSGLSMGVYPSWKELVIKISENCGLEIKNTERMTPEELMQHCDNAKDNNPVNYNKTIQDEFKCTRKSGKIYDWLVKTNFRNFVTTNFDCLLAEAITNNFNSSIIAVYPKCNFSVLMEKKSAIYLHGYVDGKEQELDIVLSKKEFDEAYNDKSSLLPSLLMQLFSSRMPICFIGCELQEDALKFILKTSYTLQLNLKSSGWNTAPKFIMLKNVDKDDFNFSPETFNKGNYESSQNAFYNDFGIKIIRYGDHYDDLDAYIKKWAGIPEINFYNNYNEDTLP